MTTSPTPTDMRAKKPRNPGEDGNIPRREGFFELMSRLNSRPVDEDTGERIKLEKKDWIALLLSAFYTLFLPSVLVLGIMVALVVLIFQLY